MALICAHTGYTYEDLRNLEYIYYNDLLEEVASKLQYMACVNILGRDYADESVFEFVDKANPINIEKIKENEKEKPKERMTLDKLKQTGLKIEFVK
jgi:hypothetical protein